MATDDITVVVFTAEPREDQSVAESLDSLEGVSVRGAAVGLQASEALIDSTRPDVAIVVMNGSVACCLRFVARLTQVRDVPVLVVSSRNERLYAERALRAGARGYLMAGAPARALLAAIRAVDHGDMYLSQEAIAVLLNEYQREASGGGRTGIPTLDA